MLKRTKGPGNEAGYPRCCTVRDKLLWHWNDLVRRAAAVACEPSFKRAPEEHLRIREELIVLRDAILAAHTDYKHHLQRHGCQFGTQVADE